MLLGNLLVSETNGDPQENGNKPIVKNWQMISIYDQTLDILEREWKILLM